jgi:hypothetical protein
MLFRANSLRQRGNAGSIGIFRLRARQPRKTTFSTRYAQDDSCVLHSNDLKCFFCPPP